MLANYIEKYAKLFFIVLGSLTTINVYALPISATFYSVPASTANNVPTIGNVPGQGAIEWGTFTASAINFSADNNYSVGGFINYAGVASAVNYMNGASATSDLTDVLFEFTGNAYFTQGQTFNVYHDDGVNLYVNGVSVLSAPSTTAPITTPYTYNGPTGTYAFDFIYANGPPTQAEFQTNLVTANTVVATTPEPSSLVLLGTGLAGVFAAARRRLNKA